MREYEHRIVFYDAHGRGPHPCHWCGKILDWKDVQIDHLNTVKTDNFIDNLVSSCGPCNRARGREKSIRAITALKSPLLELNGVAKYRCEWARELGIKSNSIARRLDAGWSLEEALTTPRGRFGPKKGASKRERPEKARRMSMHEARRREILKRHDYTCAYCRFPIKEGDAWVADHRVPLALGGADDFDNLQPLHANPCNKVKTRGDIHRITKAERSYKKDQGFVVVRHPLKSRKTVWPKGRKLQGRGFDGRRG